MTDKLNPKSVGNGVYQSSSSPAASETSSSAATDPVMGEAVGAAGRLVVGNSRPSSELAEHDPASSGEIAKPTTDLDHEARIRKEVEKQYKTLTIDILDTVKAREETERGAKFLWAPLDQETPAPRLVYVTEVLPAVRQEMPEALPSTSFCESATNAAGKPRIRRTTYSQVVGGEGIVVDVGLGTLEGRTYTHDETVGERRPANLDDMRNLEGLFAEVKEAYSGVPPTEIGQPQPPKAIDQA